MVALIAFGATIIPYLYRSQSPAGKPVLVANREQNDFANYWYQGEAEISSFDVEQSRYGEIRRGEAVMIFVTEDLSKAKQVKLDNPDEAGKDKVTVLKLNHIRRFVTGIYDYSLMQSVFTPIETKQYPNTLKTTTTSQDWCGHTFSQYNLDGNNYKVTSFSYFEKESDLIQKLPATLLEDELWTRVRINPKSIPEGETEVIPSSFFQRLQHEAPKGKKARIRFEKNESKSLLALEYLHLDRTLNISFESQFPYRILGWTELKGKETISKGVLKSSIKSAYWQKNKNEYEFLRDTLQLDF
jgi:hypothetical protein